MVLQQEDRLLTEGMTTMPVGHLATQSIALFRGRNHRAIEENLYPDAADSITIEPDDTLHKWHVRRQISSLHDELSNAFRHVNIDIIAPSSTQ